MKEFGRLSKEEREEWLRSPVTVAAIAVLRELETAMKQSVVMEAQSEGASLHSIGVQVGRAMGLNLAIEQLTRLPK